MMLMTSQSAVLKAIYSAAVVDKAIVDCNFDDQIKGQLANLII